MVSIEEVGALLDEIAESLPSEIFRELNGGILLLPKTQMHPEQVDGDLYVLGEYHQDGLGKYIIIYYGSFHQIYGHLKPDQLKEKLREVLLHEFTHHWENLAGEKDLEIEDARELAEYKQRKQKKQRKREAGR